MTIYPWSQNVSLSCIQCVTCCSLSHRPSVLFLQILVSIVGKIEWSGGSRADWLIIQQCSSFLHILHDVRHEKFQTVTKKLYSTQHYNRSGDPKTVYITISQDTSKLLIIFLTASDWSDSQLTTHLILSKLSLLALQDLLNPSSAKLSSVFVNFFRQFLMFFSQVLEPAAALLRCPDTSSSQTCKLCVTLVFRIESSRAQYSEKVFKQVVSTRVFYQ